MYITAPKPISDTSIYNLKGLLKSRWALMGSVASLFLIMLKASCWACSQTTDLSSFSISYNNPTISV